MNLEFITDPEMAPRPREEIQITEFTVTPYLEGCRVRVEIAITPFAPMDRPNLEVAAYNGKGSNAGGFNVIEAAHHRLVLTMHLRESDPQGEYVFLASLYYDDPERAQHTVSETLILPNGIPRTG